MTDVIPPSPTWMRPSVILPFIALFVVVVVLIMPQDPVDGSTDWHLTTYSTSQFSAGGLYETLTKLGWRTSRRQIPFRGPLDSATVYAILDPPIPFTHAEDSTLLRFVQQGGRLLIVSDDSAFTALFGMWPTANPRPAGYGQAISVAGDDDSIAHKAESLGDWLTTMRTLQLPPITGAVRVNDSVPGPFARFIWASAHQSDSATAPPIMLGRHLGKGSVVLLAEPSLVANMIARDRPSILAVQRALEWLAPPTGHVVFDEYHYGYGAGARQQQNVLLHALTRTAPGHVTLQVVCAALILLLAIGIRPILPVPQTTIQRRSPLEHVEALARAYATIHATQLGAQRLVRGLRRRHPAGRARRERDGEGDAAYLTAIQARYRIPQQDITTILNATQHVVSDEQFLQTGQAVGRIEETIHTGSR